MLTATRRLERRREGRKSSRRQGEARAVGTAAHICPLRPGARGRHLLFRRLHSGVGRCSAGAGAAVLHGAATFLTVTALRELDSSRPRSETARENADSPGEGPRAPWGSAKHPQHCRLVGTGHDGPQHRGPRTDSQP